MFNNTSLIKKIALTLFFSNSFLQASEQATLIKNNEYLISKHSFSNSEVYDYKTNNFKFLNGTNFYGIKASKNTDGITLIYDNPKSKNLHYKDLEYRLEILTPDISEKERFFINGNRSIDFSSNNTKKRYIIPFIIGADVNQANASNNKLILKNGELSSVITLHPSDIEKLYPQNNIDEYNSAENDFIYAITASRVVYGNSTNNTTQIQSKAILNLGSQNDYNLKLNGAPFISGATATYGNANNNKLLIEKDAKFYLKAKTYKDIEHRQNFDDIITHFIGGGAVGDTLNNQIIFDGAYVIAQGAQNTYSTIGAFNMVGGYTNSLASSTKHDSKNNTVWIKQLKLATRSYSEEDIKNYNAIIFANIIGGKVKGQGDAINNTIKVSDIQSYAKENNKQTQGYFNFYGGITDNGQANENSLDIHLKEPINVQKNFIGKHIFNFYGGFGTEGASGNSVIIKNNFSIIKNIENYYDRATIAAARTLSGQADNNEVVLDSLVSNLPLFIYAVKRGQISDNLFYADEANNNKININNIHSKRNLTTIIEAQNVKNNIIAYNKVLSLSDANSLTKGSAAIIKSINIAENNSIYFKEYSSSSGDNSYMIMGDKQAFNNNIFIENATFGAGSGKKTALLKIFAGAGEKTFNNLLSLKNITLDEFNKNEKLVFISPSAVPLNKIDTSKSYNNTLYLGGYFETFQGSYIDVLSGAVAYKLNPNNNRTFAQALPPKVSFTKDNHLILDINYIDSKIINNFEHFSFIISPITDKNNPLLRAFDQPINLSKYSIFNILSKNIKLYKGEKITLMHSTKGFSDIHGTLFTQKEDLDQLLEKISKNKKEFIYSKIPELKNSKLLHYNFKLESSGDLKSIFIEII